jgi:homoserine kinase type II
MSQAQQFPHQGGGSTRAAELESAAALLPLWGLTTGAEIALIAEQGVNNRTYLVHSGRQRYVLRVTAFRTIAEVRAEHLILRRLRQGVLPFQVPEPVAAPGGRTVIETPAGPATLCRWLSGVRPGVGSEMAFERLGRAVGLIDGALAQLPIEDALQDWRTDPRWVRPEDPPAGALVAELRSAGLGAEQARLVTAAARRAGRWWPGTDRLPAQVIHGDLTPANLLADPRTGEVTGLLDFELAGAGFRVQDVMAALFHSAALTTPDWPRREPAEVAALPELLIAQSLGSVLWRTVRWRAGLARFGDVVDRVERLEASTRWLAANQDTFLSVAAAANARS